jgi:hypothetical protein
VRNRSAALASSSTGIICSVRIRRSGGEHRTRLISANRRLRRHGPPDTMPRRCCEFVDSRLRRSPPDRASAVPYGQAGEKAMRFPHLAHRSAPAHKLHSTPQQDGINLISGNGETSSRLPAFSLFLPGSCPNNRDRRRHLPLWACRGFELDQLAEANSAKGQAPRPYRVADWRQRRHVCGLPR